MKRKTIFCKGRQAVVVACSLLIGASVFQSCKDEDDILTGQPGWLGNSIYERLEEDGNYTNLLRLVDDLGQKDVLSQTGSKTVFAADDNAFGEWYRTNLWGARSYEQLTTAQKKRILNNTMINNAYLISLMSNVMGNPPLEGRAMRRLTAASIFDSVYMMPIDKMPKTTAWDYVRERGKAIPLFLSESPEPMIHFLPPYMRYNKISDSDLEILTNHQSNSIADCWVNGKKVIEADITCKNGYIHKVNGVVEAAPNMAEILRQHPELSDWSRLMDRYSAPYYDAAITREYNRIFNNEDSAFVLRYFNNQSGQEVEKLPNGQVVPAYLSFDPGDNTYMYTNTMDYDLHYDAGALIVPTNEALSEWWNGKGKELQAEYTYMDSVPAVTLSKLLRVNMLPTFTESVPSKFNHVLNDAKDKLGITANDVVACYMGCNGVVYVVNKVFTPAEFASVVYPATAHQAVMSTVYWAIDERNFLPYLLSMSSNYALLLPNNTAMLTYLDPATYGKKDGTEDAPTLIKFIYDNTKSQSQKVQAFRVQCTVDADGIIHETGTPEIQITSRDIINTMLEDLMDQLIVILPQNSNVEDLVKQGYHYFKSKGGTLMYADYNSSGEICFAGGYQLEHNKQLIPAIQMYPKDNGRSYEVEAQVPLGAQRSLYMLMQDPTMTEYEAFLNLMKNDYVDMFTKKIGTSNSYTVGNADLGNENFSLFDNFNYTVFIPTSSSIKALQKIGSDPNHSGADAILPTEYELTKNLTDEVGNEIIDELIVDNGWATKAQITDALRDSVSAAMKSILTEFIRYHVQDRSVAIGMAPEPTVSGNAYESMLRNPETGRFYQLTTDFTTTNLTVKDVAGNVRNVVTSDPKYYNNMVREYWFRGSGTNMRLFMGSDAMVHLIDQPLSIYKTPKPWRQRVKEYLGK